MKQRRGKRRRCSPLCPTTTSVPTTVCVDEALAEDYASMLAIGILLHEDEPFGTLLQRWP